MIICGIDEAGRGPLAGPVYASAVILPDNFPVHILNDSKKLSEKKREEGALIIKEKALAFGIGFANHEEIDKINILQASFLAMRRAFENMLKSGAAPDKIIVDGSRAPDFSMLSKAEVVPLVKADAKIHAVMAASILAKTERDAEMRRLAALYPEYRYDKHKGYPTKEHAALIRRFGASPIQRLTFNVPE